MLHARSGAGKTLLLNAGLAPHFIREGRLPVCARAYDDPARAIKRALAPPLIRGSHAPRTSMPTSGASAAGPRPASASRPTISWPDPSWKKRSRARCRCWTRLQYATVDRVSITINGTPLDDLLGLR